MISGESLDFSKIKNTITDDGVCTTMHLKVDGRTGRTGSLKASPPRAMQQKLNKSVKDLTAGLGLPPSTRHCTEACSPALGDEEDFWEYLNLPSSNSKVKGNI